MTQKIQHIVVRSGTLAGSDGVRIVRIATPGSTPGGCADCADRRAGLDPRRVCGSCGSPRRARPPKGVRIVRISAPGLTPEGCADCADRHAGLDPRRVCGLCGSPRRARPPESVRIVRIATPGSTPEGCADCADAAPGSTPGECADCADAAPGSTPGECADCADRPTGGQVTVRDDFPHRGIFRLTRSVTVPILFPNRNGTTTALAAARTVGQAVSRFGIYETRRSLRL